jgi:uridine kinase
VPASRIVRRRAGQLLHVGVGGCSASGKTRLADVLALVLAEAGREVLRARLDDVKRFRNERLRYDRESADGNYRNAYGYALLRADLPDPFGSGVSRRYRHGSINPATGVPFSHEKASASESPILLSDGVILMRPEFYG